MPVYVYPFIIRITSIFASPVPVKSGVLSPIVEPEAGYIIPAISGAIVS